MTEPATFLVDHADVPTLRNAVSKLAAAGYSEISVRERLGVDDIAGLNWRAVPAYRLERLEARDPLALAIDLFLLQGSLPASELNRLFPLAEQEALIRSGILAIDETGIARARASRVNRATKSRESASTGGRIFSATMRSS